MKDVMGTSAGAATSNAAKEGTAKKRQWIEDYEIPKEAMTAKVPEKPPVESSDSMASSSEADEAETSLATTNTAKQQPTSKKAKQQARRKKPKKS